MGNGEHSVAIIGGTTNMELRIFVDSLGILEVPNIQQEVVLGQYMQGTDSVVGERRLFLIVHYRQEELTLQGALIVLIKGCTAQEEELMDNGGLGDPGPHVILRLQRRKEQGSVTVRHLLMVESSAMDHQLRKFSA